jgi:hypothetical protein
MIRNNQGEFKKDHTLAGFIITTIVVAVFVISGVWYHYTHPIIETKTVTITNDISSSTYAAKIDSLQKSVVEQVRACESAGYKETYGLVTYDPKIEGKNDDKAMSYGTLQFKKSTVIYYEKTLFGKTITGKEAILIALDDKASGELAQAIMFKSNNLATDWANCSNKLNLNSMIIAIKKIQ